MHIYETARASDAKGFFKSRNSLKTSFCHEICKLATPSLLFSFSFYVIQENEFIVFDIVFEHVGADI